MFRKSVYMCGVSHRFISLLEIRLYNLKQHLGAFHAFLIKYHSSHLSLCHTAIYSRWSVARDRTQTKILYIQHTTHTHKDIINRYARKCHLKYDSTRNIVLTKTCLKVPQRLWLILKCMRDPIWDIGSLTQLKFTGCNVSKRHINDIK